jgi:hypothetical protein
MNKEKTIGVAWMQEDGTLYIRLRDKDEDCMRYSLCVYDPADEDYQLMLNYLGGLIPGELKSVPAW